MKPIHSRTLAAIGAVAAGSALLVGCSSATSGAAGSASPSAPSAPSESASASPSADVSRNALFAYPVSTVFWNQANQVVNVNGTGMNGKAFDRNLTHGQRMEVEGYNTTGVDIVGYLDYPDKTSIPFKMKNPNVGQPWVEINGASHKFAVGTEWTTTQKGHPFKVTRAADAPSGNKVFSFTIL